MSPPFDVGPWPGLELVEPAAGGHRSEVWRGRLDGRDVSVRRSRRSPPSIDWELDLLGSLAQHGFSVPEVVTTDDGRRRDGPVIVQEWLEGHEPVGDEEWRRVADELRRLHRLTAGGHPQRPGACRVDELATVRRSVDADLDVIPRSAPRRLLEVFAGYGDVEVAVIHGDLAPGNIRIGDDGRVGLLDWDESRVDVVWHDLSNLGVAVLPPEHHARALRLSDAWEAANAWVLEPEYAASRLRSLGDADT